MSTVKFLNKEKAILQKGDLAQCTSLQDFKILRIKAFSIWT
jgi:hypothetical protein